MAKDDFIIHIYKLAARLDDTTMTKQILTIISLLLLFSCELTTKKTDTNCTATKDLTIGQVVVALPTCYTLHYPDSLDRNHMYLVKDDTIKLEISTDGLASLAAFEDLKANDLFTTTDTIENCLRVINNKPDFSVFIVELTRQDTTIFDLFESSKQFQNEHRHYVKLNANTLRDCKLSTNEVDLLTKAFRTSKIINNEKPSR